LRRNVEAAFAVASWERRPPANTLAASSATDRPDGGAPRLIASNATPYRLTISKFFPQPALPLDNPLTEEGVELGRRLFFDPRLSINNRQSCASCHQPGRAFSESRAVSLGAEGTAGTRNAMPLVNLAWKSAFFWDG